MIQSKLIPCDANASKEHCFHFQSNKPRFCCFCNKYVITVEEAQARRIAELEAQVAATIYFEYLSGIWKCRECGHTGAHGAGYKGVPHRDDCFTRQKVTQ